MQLVLRRDPISGAPLENRYRSYRTLASLAPSRSLKTKRDNKERFRASLRGETNATAGDAGDTFHLRLINWMNRSKPTCLKTPFDPPHPPRCLTNRNWNCVARLLSMRRLPYFVGPTRRSNSVIPPCPVGVRRHVWFCLRSCSYQRQANPHGLVFALMWLSRPQLRDSTSSIEQCPRWCESD